MKKLFVLLAMLLGSICSSAQDTASVVILTPEVRDSIGLSEELGEILDEKMVQMCTLNCVEAGESRFVLTSEVRIADKSMTATIPPKCMVEIAVYLEVTDKQTAEVISRTKCTLKAIESNEDKAIYKAISRVNVKSSQIRKFITVTKNKIEGLK